MEILSRLNNTKEEKQKCWGGVIAHEDVKEKLVKDEWKKKKSPAEWNPMGE